MRKTELHIKNMVCDRCIMVVKNELTSLNIKVLNIALGHVRVNMPDDLSMEAVASTLETLGFELLLDKDTLLVEQTKLAAMAYLQMPVVERQETALSKFVALSVGKNYSYVSKRFSKVEGRTIEQYYIHLRIEKVKELIDDDELSLSQIATTLGYSSVHYLSCQFKKVTGTSVTSYRKDSLNKGSFLRKPLDKV